MPMKDTLGEHSTRNYHREGCSRLGYLQGYLWHPYLLSLRIPLAQSSPPYAIHLIFIELYLFLENSSHHCVGVSMVHPSLGRIGEEL